MGQKVNPHGLRVGIIKDWDAKWYAEKDFADNLVEDVKIRKFIKKRLCRHFQDYNRKNSRQSKDQRIHSKTRYCYR